MVKVVLIFFVPFFLWEPQRFTPENLLKWTTSAASALYPPPESYGSADCFQIESNRNLGKTLPQQTFTKRPSIVHTNVSERNFCAKVSFRMRRRPRDSWGPQDPTSSASRENRLKQVSQRGLGRPSLTRKTGNTTNSECSHSCGHWLSPGYKPGESGSFTNVSAGPSLSLSLPTIDYLV